MNCKQTVNETAPQFIFRAMSLRQNFLFISQEDLIPYPPSLVMKRYLQAVLSGLRNNNIRNHLRPLLEFDGLSDEFLLETVSKLVAEEKEHYEKFSKKTVNSVESKTGENDNDLVGELKELRLEVNQLSTLRSEISHLREQLNRNLTAPKRRTRKCKNCMTQNVARCEHCFSCGESGHFSADCSEKKR